ncbi:unnamed protein product [Lathyrus oleraceus]
MGGRLSRTAPARGDVEMQQNPRGGGGGGGGGGDDDDEDINTFVRRLYLVIGVSGVITIIAVVFFARDSHEPLVAAEPPMLPPLPAPMLPPMPLPKP